MEVPNTCQVSMDSACSFRLVKFGNKQNESMFGGRERVEIQSGAEAQVGLPQ